MLTRRRAFSLMLVAMVGLGAFTAWRFALAYQAGIQGKGALVRAQESIAPGETDDARRELRVAQVAFARMGRQLDGLGPMGAVLRAVPLVRVQMRGAEAFQRAGSLLAGAGLELSSAFDKLREPSGDESTAGRLVPHLATAQKALDSSALKIEQAVAHVEDLDGYRLIGPLGSARDELLERLVPIALEARSATQGARGLRTFFGQDGPRRYLVLSQNPEEVRPTGGFIGTYSVMETTDDGGLALVESAAIDAFLEAHPDVRVPADQTSGVFRINQQRPTLANVNYLADWRLAGTLASRLWREAGRQPVDGVVGITPAFLAHVLDVTGPVEVASYNETVTSANLIDRLQFYTEQVAARSATNTARKAFAGEVAAIALNRMLEVPSSDWPKLARAVGEGFGAREAMVWSRDANVMRAVAQRRWDGSLPAGRGDFFYNGEFAYAAKNGRGLRRTFDHRVVLAKDGSARITTTMTLADPEPRNRLTLSALNYVTVYGPKGAKLHPASDKPANAREPAVNGHPAAGWLVEPPALSSAKLKVVWTVPRLGIDLPGDRWSYDLRFMGVPDHRGDVLRLRVDLPRGWEWKGPKPPAKSSLDDDVIGSWTYGP